MNTYSNDKIIGKSRDVVQIKPDVRVNSMSIYKKNMRTEKWKTTDNPIVFYAENV